MADFEAIIKGRANEEGSIPADAIGSIVSEIKKAVGNEFVDRARYKEKLSEIDGLKAKLADMEDGLHTAESWKKKYEDEASAFESFKKEKEAEATEGQKKKAYKELLKEVGVSEKWRERAMKGVSFKELELDEEGKFKNAENLTKAIKEEWGDCIATEGEEGANTANPPQNKQSEEKAPSRAAQIAAKYHENLYGKED